MPRAYLVTRPRQSTLLPPDTSTSLQVPAAGAGGSPVEGRFHRRHRRDVSCHRHGSAARLQDWPFKSHRCKPGSDQTKPRLYKKQGNIMQDRRKSEETAFWAGLARSLCELQLTSKARSLAPNSAENIPSAAKDNTPHASASGLHSRTPCTWWNADKPGSYFSPSLHLFLKFGAYFWPMFVRSGKRFVFTALLIDRLFLRSL